MLASILQSSTFKKISRIERNCDNTKIFRAKFPDLQYSLLVTKLCCNLFCSQLNNGFCNEYKALGISTTPVYCLLQEFNQPTKWSFAEYLVEALVPHHTSEIKSVVLDDIHVYLYSKTKIDCFQKDFRR